MSGDEDIMDFTPEKKQKNTDKDRQRQGKNESSKDSDDGWPTAGYISMSNSQKGLIIKIDDEKYFVNKKYVAQVMRGNEDYTTIKKMPKQKGGGR